MKKDYDFDRMNGIKNPYAAKKAESATVQDTSDWMARCRASDEALSPDS